MLTTFIILCTCMLLYMLFYYKINIAVIFILKVITSACFVLLGFLAYLKSLSSTYHILILLGLVFGFLGDFVLGLRRLIPKKEKVFFIMGMLLFFIGNILYISSFLTLSKNQWYLYFIFTVILTSTLIVIINKVCIINNEIRYYVYVYILGLSLTYVVANINLIGEKTIKNYIVFFGAFAFIVSDFLLYILYFKKINHKQKRILKMLNIIFYYVAQVLYALSIK